MKILVCNVGSTSLKYRLFDLTHGEDTLSEGRMERVGTQAGAWTHKDAGGESIKQKLPIPDYATGIRLMQGALLARALELDGRARLRRVQGGARKGRYRRAAARRNRAFRDGGVQYRCAKPQPAVYRRDSPVSRGAARHAHGRFV